MYLLYLHHTHTNGIHLNTHTNVIQNGALHSDFMFVNFEPYKSGKCVPY